MTFSTSLNINTVPNHISTSVLGYSDSLLLGILCPWVIALMPQKLIFVSFDINASSESFRCSLWNLQHVRTCAFYSVGCKAKIHYDAVVSMVLLMTAVPATLRSLMRSSCKVVELFVTFLMITLTPWGNISHGAPHRGLPMIILYFFHLPRNTIRAFAFLTSFLLMILPIPQPFAVLLSCFCHFF